MIIFRGIDGDVIIIEHEEEIDLDFHRVVGGSCLVKLCRSGDYLYGFNFCRKHQWILPISSHKIEHGFQVALIKYWKEQGKKIIQTNKYHGKKLSTWKRIRSDWFG